jgi:hypothetical protein
MHTLMNIMHCKYIFYVCNESTSVSGNMINFIKSHFNYSLSRMSDLMNAKNNNNEKIKFPLQKKSCMKI